MPDRLDSTCRSQKSISGLQFFQNAAARIFTGSKCGGHITPVLAHLHRPPIRFQIDFKIFLLASKGQKGITTTYNTDLLKLLNFLLVDPQLRPKVIDDFKILISKHYKLRNIHFTLIF